MNGVIGEEGTVLGLVLLLGITLGLYALSVLIGWLGIWMGYVLRLFGGS